MGSVRKPAPKAFGWEGTAGPGVEESPESGIRGVEIALARVSGILLDSCSLLEQVQFPGPH